MSSPSPLSHAASAALVPHTSWVHWTVFGLATSLLLAIDLGVFQRTPREPTVKEALGWSAVWMALAVLFGAGVTATMGTDKGLQFFTGYAVEQALSVDNLFVMMLVFAQFAVPREAQRRVLLWGIVGAVVLRAALVFTGTALVARFHFLTYLLGALLVAAAFKLLREVMQPKRAKASNTPGASSAPVHDAHDSHGGRVRRVLERFVPITHDYDGARFVVVRGGLRYATPLLLALLTIELADAVFALDSIPAVFAVSTDPFIVFTSNLFAVLGLRSLYFALAGMLERLVYLKHGLAAVLALVGVKMLAHPFFHLPEWVTLVAVVAILAVAALASLFATPSHERNADESLQS